MRQVRRRFPDGVFWVTVGEQGDLVAAQLGLLARLGAAHPELRSAGQGLALLREALADRRCLLVVDDVWSAAAAAAFRAAGPRGRVLYTTRDPAVLEGVAADVVRARGAAPACGAGAAARADRGAALPAEADRICAATGGVALALALVGAAIGAGGRSWAAGRRAAGGGGRRSWITRMRTRSRRCRSASPRWTKMMRRPTAAWRSTPRTPWSRWRRSAACGRTCLVPRRRTRRRGWSGSRPAACSRCKPAGVSFHDLQREFLLLHTEDLPLAHADLLAAYRALLPPGASWARLPPGEPYIWDHLVYHLRGAGDGAAIQAVACDLAWIAIRSFGSGPYAAESDLRQAAGPVPRACGDRLAAAAAHPVGPPAHRASHGRGSGGHARQPRA